MSNRTPGTTEPVKKGTETNEEKERKRARSAKRAAGLEGGLTPMELFSECFGGYPPVSVESGPATAVQEDFAITPSFRDSVKQAISHFYRGNRRATSRARSAMSTGRVKASDKHGYGYAFGAPGKDEASTDRNMVYRPASSRRRPRRPQSSAGHRVLRIRQRPASAFSRREMFRILQSSPRRGGRKGAAFERSKQRPATSTGLKQAAPAKLRVEVHSPPGTAQNRKKKMKKKENKKEQDEPVLVDGDGLQRVSDEFSMMLAREFWR